MSGMDGRTLFGITFFVLAVFVSCEHQAQVATEPSPTPSPTATPCSWKYMARPAPTLLCVDPGKCSPKGICMEYGDVLRLKTDPNSTTILPENTVVTPTPSPNPYPSGPPGPPGPRGRRGAAGPSGPPGPMPTLWPTPSPTASPVGPAHVLTGAYLNALPSPTPSVYAPFVTYAYTGDSQAAAFQNAGVQIVAYTNPMQPICTKQNSNGTCVLGDVVAFNYLNTGGLYSSVAARDCSGNVITGSYGTSGYPVLFADPRSAQASVYIAAVETAEQNNLLADNPGSTQPWNLMFVDNAVARFYNPSATPCGLNAAQWMTATAVALDGTSTGPYVANALGFNSASGVSSALNVLGTATVSVGEYEQCYANTQLGLEGDGWWNAVEYAEMATIAHGQMFWCYNDETGAGSSMLAQRLYTYASFLLTYDRPLAVYETAYGSTSGLTVYPETQFVPTLPLSTEPNVAGYITAQGYYLRQFAQCFLNGSFVGMCAVAVNPSSTANATVITPYTTSLVLSGGDILSGGTAANGGPACTTLAPETACILLP